MCIAWCNCMCKPANHYAKSMKEFVSQTENNFPLSISPQLLEIIKLKIQVHVPYSLDQMLRLLFISSINFVWPLFESGDYLQVAFLFCSANPFADIKESKAEQDNYQTDTENVLVVADQFTVLFLSLLCQFTTELSCVHGLFKLSHPLQLLFKSSVCFVQHVWRCGYCLRAAPK